MASNFEADYDTLHLVCFQLGDLRFAADIKFVQEIVSMIEIRKIPHAPDFIEGIINLRGTIIPLVDMRKQFRVETTIPLSEAKIIVFTMKNKQIGFIVDQVSHVVHRRQREVKKAPPIVMVGIDKSCIYGIISEEEANIMLIDFRRVFSPKESSDLEKILNKV